MPWIPPNRFRGNHHNGKIRNSKNHGIYKILLMAPSWTQSWKSPGLNEIKLRFPSFSFEIESNILLMWFARTHHSLSEQRHAEEVNWEVARVNYGCNRPKQKAQVENHTVQRALQPQTGGPDNRERKLTDHVQSWQDYQHNHSAFFCSALRSTWTFMKLSTPTSRD